MNEKRTKRQPNPPRKCMFCNGGSISREHVFARWMRPYLNAHPSTHHSLRRGVVRNGQLVMTESMDGPQSRPGEHRGQKLKVVCKHCNETWMGTMQSETKPILEPMLQGTSRSLEHADYRTLATWATMFTMVWERADPITAATTEAQRRDFMSDKRRGRNWSVWMGTFEGEIGTESVWHRGLTYATPPITSTQSNVQFKMIGVGPCFFFTFSTLEDDAFNVFFPRVAHVMSSYQLRPLCPEPSILAPEQSLGGISIDMYPQIQDAITSALIGSS